MRSPAVVRSWSLAYVVLVVGHLAALAAGVDPVADVTQSLFAPVLAATLVVATRWPRGHVVSWTLAALVGSFLGDTVPRFVGGDASFLVMVGCFLVAQVCYVVAFAVRSRRSVLRRAPGWLVPYAAVLAALVGLCAPHAGTLLVPVAVYGGVLTAMAVLATGLGRLGAVGGAVFLVSDALIAVERFVPGWDLPGQGLWVMATYAAGQALLVVAVTRDNRARRRARPVVRATASAPRRDNVVALVAARGHLGV